MDAGHHPMLVARGLHAAVMMTEGLRLTDDGGRERTYAPDQFTVHPTDGPREMPTNLDIIILSGKTHHISNLLDAVEGSTTEDSVIIPVCNGLTGAAEVTKRFGIGHLVLGSTTHGAERIAPGHVRRRGKGRLLLGSVHGEAVDSRIAMLLEIPGLSAEWDPMIRESSVRKFLLNLAINPLAAIMGSRNGALRNPEPWACMVAVIEESLPILRASGHPTPTKADVLAELATVLDATASNRCAMLQDVIRGSNGDRGAEWDDRAYSNRDGHPCTAQSNPHDAHSIDVGDCSRSRLRCKPMFILRSQLAHFGSTSRPEPCS